MCKFYTQAHVSHSIPQPSTNPAMMSHLKYQAVDWDVSELLGLDSGCRLPSFSGRWNVKQLLNSGCKLLLNITDVNHQVPAAWSTVERMERAGGRAF